MSGFVSFDTQAGRQAAQQQAQVAFEPGWYVGIIRAHEQKQSLKGGPKVQQDGPPAGYYDDDPGY